ncbi:MAG TPA: hypothetical protein VMH90_00255, partial [Thermoplasmata archaeon]|nr:hypothetical protein [Thermoplasmata archaeon]
MMDVWVELSGENVPLAAAEAVAAAEALGGSGGDLSAAPPEGLGVVVALPSEEATVALAFRVALAYRCLVRLPCRTEEEARAWFRSEARPGVSAVFRPVGQPTSSPVDPVRTWAGAWKAGDGKIDLRSPDRRFWYARGPGDRYWLGEELSRVDRQERSHRRMPTLPFQRPVSLPPRLGRVAANLARIRP